MRYPQGYSQPVLRFDKPAMFVLGGWRAIALMLAMWNVYICVYSKVCQHKQFSYKGQNL